jgi:hypothetical protein
MALESTAAAPTSSKEIGNDPSLDHLVPRGEEGLLDELPCGVVLAGSAVADGQHHAAHAPRCIGTVLRRRVAGATQGFSSTQ